MEARCGRGSIHHMLEQHDVARLWISSVHDACSLAAVRQLRLDPRPERDALRVGCCPRHATLGQPVFVSYSTSKYKILKNAGTNRYHTQVAANRPWRLAAWPRLMHHATFTQFRSAKTRLGLRTRIVPAAAHAQLIRQSNRYCRYQIANSPAPPPAPRKGPSCMQGQ